jgi:hypothetical protein
LRNIAIVGFLGLVAGCGGSGNSNWAPNLKTYNYGTPVAATTTQKAAASNAQTSIHSLSGSTASGQTAQAASAPGLTDSIGEQALGALVANPEDPGAQSLTAERGAREGLAAIIAHSAGLAAHQDTALNTNCAVISASTVTYNNCTYSASGYSYTLNGTITVASNTVTWNVTFSGALSGSGYSYNYNGAWSGTVTITATTIVGDGRSAWVGHYSYGGTTVDYSYSLGIDLNLTYTSSPWCVTSGTLEVRRTVSWSGQGSSPLSNKGLKFTWSGCNQVLVAQGS